MALANRHGEDHAIQALQAINCHNDNSTEPYAESLQAVSLYLIEADFEGMDIQIARDLLGSMELARLRKETKAIRLGNTALGMADRLCAMTQVGGWLKGDEIEGQDEDLGTAGE